MGLYKQLDWWSITDMVDEIMEGRANKCFRNSEYAGYYDELLTEMADAAGDLWCDIDRIKGDICRHDIPWKARKFAEEDEETETAAFWFNTVALTLTETDVSLLFERENNYEDEESQKEKRLRMLGRLSKNDLLWIVPTVCNLIFRYLDLCGAWEAVKGTIDELDSRQAFVKDKDGLREPKAAYL
nr:hypothetical protein [uncultured Acetatifactor sp.]